MIQRQLVIPRWRLLLYIGLSWPHDLARLLLCTDYIQNHNHIALLALMSYYGSRPEGNSFGKIQVALLARNDYHAHSVARG